jgi:hypothetical protein
LLLGKVFVGMQVIAHGDDGVSVEVVEVVFQTVLCQKIPVRLRVSNDAVD